MPKIADEMTCSVVLTDSQARFVKQMVSSGHYQNASEVLRDGLCLWFLSSWAKGLSITT